LIYSRYTSIALLALSGILFSSLSIFSVYLSDMGIGAWAQSLARMGGSCLFFMLAGVYRYRRLPDLRNPLFWLNGSFMLGAGVAYLLSLELGTPPTKAILMAFMYPIYVMILGAVLLGEPFTWQSGVAVIAGVLGVAITLEFWTIQSEFATGDLLAILDGMIVSGLVMTGRIVGISKKSPPQEITLAGSYFGAVAWLAVIGLGYAILKSPDAVMAEIHYQFSLKAIFHLTGIVLLSTAIPIFMMYTGFRRIPSGIGSIFMLVEPASLFILAAIFLDDSITRWHVVGGVAILGAGLLAAMSVRPSRQTQLKEQLKAAAG
jgi:drug/metabolite transporter (DMT)-like permease